MSETQPLRRLGWFVPLRLATYVILLVEVVFWMKYPEYLRPLFVGYSLLTLTLAVVMALGSRRAWGLAKSLVIAVQFIAEVAVEAALIYATGNYNSPFSALFVLTIVSAALVYRLVGTLLVASLVSFAYSFIIWFGFSASSVGDSGGVLKTIFSVGDSVFYSIFLHFLIFYLTAFVSGYLAEHLKKRDQKLADTSQALRRARLETDDILRHLNSGLLTIDAFGHVIYFNRAAERILGYREQDVRGLVCEEVFAERMPTLAEYLMDGIRSRQPHPRCEMTISTVEGATTPLGVSTSVLTEEGGELRGVIAIFSDLTEAKRLEAKARAADRLAAVGELSASIAHEIRNPLAAISGSVEVLSRELQLEGENARLMNLIEKESTRLNKVLSDFLAYARIDRPAFNKVELCHVVNEVIDLLRHHSHFHPGVSVRFNSREPIVYGIGDEDLTKQLLLNLAVNACESFEGKAGEIHFRIEEVPAPDRVRLSISDNGPGMPPEIQRRIYQPFYSTKKRGTGLGLSIVHRICSAMKLSISVESAPGEGTRFTIDFPALSATDKVPYREVSRTGA